MDCSLPGPSVHGIFQARAVERAAMLSSQGSSQPRDRTHIFCSSCMGRQILYYGATQEATMEVSISIEIITIIAGCEINFSISLGKLSLLPHSISINLNSFLS